MPMDKNTTSKKTTPETKELPTTAPKVSEQTLAFLRAFAYNYHVEPTLPKGIQGIILG